MSMKKHCPICRSPIGRDGLRKERIESQPWYKFYKVTCFCKSCDVQLKARQSAPYMAPLIGVGFYIGVRYSLYLLTNNGFFSKGAGEVLFKCLPLVLILTILVINQWFLEYDTVLQEE